MSRYNEGDGDEDFNNQWAFYTANARRALKGKRGRKVLAELREALLALPEKRLIASAMCTVDVERRKAEHPDYEYDGRTIPNYTRESIEELVAEQGEGVCAVGAYLWHRNVKAGMDPAEAFAQLPTLPGDESDLSETAGLARSAGVVFGLAWELAYRNDETFESSTPEERWVKFIAWIDAELGAVPTAAGR